ncbi:MAG: hypothetical protein SP1CHLAM54_03430 [Chlamydiia bacterium]|nr:hypothetical protein [Chlamydiia bacterium]MCH9615259.1 hypothetical protein [Chlamydiia bacterium]MCH9628419.1 hypothetical protein [Chlamydiia bacterium]
MDGVHLQFFVNEFHKHQGKLVYEWVLEFAKKNGVHGGSVFKAVAGYGRHGVMHSEHFFELASEVPMRIDFFVEKTKGEELIKLLKQEKLDLFYSLSPSNFGTLT